MDAFDEYRFLALSTQFLTERRQVAIRIYLTVNTLIFAVLGVLLKEAVFREWLLLVVSLSLSAVGVLACWVWYRTLVHYRELIAWRYHELMKMEQEPALSATHSTECILANGTSSTGRARPAGRSASPISRPCSRGSSWRSTSFTLCASCWQPQLVSDKLRAS